MTNGEETTDRVNGWTRIHAPPGDGLELPPGDLLKKSLALVMELLARWRARPVASLTRRRSGDLGVADSGVRYVCTEEVRRMSASLVPYCARYALAKAGCSSVKQEPAE